MRSRCRCALKKAFLYRWVLHELKNCSFPQNKRFSFTESFTLCSQKPLVFATKTPLVRTIFYCCKSRLFYLQKPIFCKSLSLLVSKNAHFHKPKAFLLHKPFLIPIQSNSFPPSAPPLITVRKKSPFSQTKSLSFIQILP